MLIYITVIIIFFNKLSQNQLRLLSELSKANFKRNLS